MLRVGLVGIGAMGRGHLDIWLRLMKEEAPVQLVAICDIDKDKFKNKFLPGNMNIGLEAKYDFTPFHCYQDMGEMLAKEQLDIVDMALPTYIHAPMAIQALEAGCHVLCEKPMARTGKQCQDMIAAAKKARKKLMIAQCLRFFGEYIYLKDTIDSGRLGKVEGAYFFRGGDPPLWSYQNWLMQDDKAGGALLDQHIHDVDTINWLFGKPDAVSSIGRNIIPGSGYDFVSTNYIYKNGPSVNAQDDWCLYKSGFGATYRVGFEKGSLTYADGKLWEGNVEEDVRKEVKFDKESGYYREVRYFIDRIMDKTPMSRVLPQSTALTIRIAEAEIASCNKGGIPVKVR